MWEVRQRAERRRPPGSYIAALGARADWLWEYYTHYLPGHLEILDLYHPTERWG
ncbi:MAG: hypothetical protein ACO1SX_13485 [Actinomycetota bacterium]